MNNLERTEAALYALRETICVHCSDALPWVEEYEGILHRSSLGYGPSARVCRARDLDLDDAARLLELLERHDPTS